MNRYILLAFALFTVLTMSSCSGGISLLNAGGDVITVNMHNKVSYTGELLAVEDSALACMLDQGSSGDIHTKQGSNRFVRLPYHQIEKIVIEGYSNRGWILPVVLFEVVPGVLFAIEVVANVRVVDAGPLIALTAIPLIITIGGFAATTPAKPEAEQPFTPEVIRELQKYARFPGGLTPAQWEEFLKASK